MILIFGCDVAGPNGRASVAVYSIISYESPFSFGSHLKPGQWGS